MPHIFHVMDLDPIFHMILGRPWIHDHRCVPSSWHQCIKAAPIKGSQIRIRGLLNPFAMEEAHYLEAGFFMEGNVLKMSREKPSSHSYSALVDLPSFIKPTANYPPKRPPKCLKSHHSGVTAAPAFTNNPNGSLIPLSVTVHGAKPTGPPPPNMVNTEAKKMLIQKEDLAMATARIEFPISNLPDTVLYRSTFSPKSNNS